MKNSKTYWSVLFALMGIVAMLSLAGCSKDDDEVNTKFDVWKEYSTAEIYSHLEVASSNYDANAESIAEALTDNPNIEESYLTDGGDLVVRMKGENVYTVYPMVEAEDYCEYEGEAAEEAAEEEDSEAKGRSEVPTTSNSEMSSKIAIFNYFTGMSSRKGQNAVMEQMQELFEKYGFQVEYYEYEKFTRANITNVVSNSTKYNAIVVMSDGCVVENTVGSWIALYDDWKDKNDGPETEDIHVRFWQKTKYKQMINVENLKTDKGCILYVGACEAGLSALSNTTSLSWTNKNRMSQAHALLVFERMLSEGKTLDKACELFWDNEPPTYWESKSKGPTAILKKRGAAATGTGINTRNFDNFTTCKTVREALNKKYDTNYTVTAFGDAGRSYWHIKKLNPIQDFFEGDPRFLIEGKIPNWYSNKPETQIWAELYKIQDIPTGSKKNFKVNEDGTFSCKLTLDKSELEGIYNLRFYYVTKEGRVFLPTSKKCSIIYSSKFSENYAYVPEIGQETNDITSGLVAYYPFNGNADDESGNGNNASDLDNVTLTTGVDGKEEGAYLFGGYYNPGYIEVPNSESLQFDDECTFSVWVKVNDWGGETGNGSYVADGIHTLIAKYSDRNGITMHITGNSDSCFVWCQALFESWNDEEYLVLRKNLPGDYLGKWVHAAMSMDATGYRIYVNGQLTVEHECTPDFTTTNTQNMRFGYGGNAWYPLNGALDEIRIYNRALNETEINTLANMYK